jgi:hypothetical protein
MTRNANVVAMPRLKPRRVKILMSGSIEKARKPAATSQVTVSRTSQRPTSAAPTKRSTAIEISAVVAKNRRFGRPSGTWRDGPMEATAD